MQQPKILQILLNKLHHFFVKMPCRVAAVDSVVFVGVLHKLKLLVSLNQSLAKDH